MEKPELDKYRLPSHRSIEGYRELFNKVDFNMTPLMPYVIRAALHLTNVVEAERRRQEAWEWTDSNPPPNNRMGLDGKPRPSV